MAQHAPPWTIKNLALPVRQKALKYAAQDGSQMAEWLEKAIERQCAAQDGITVLPPDRPGRPEPASSPRMPRQTVSSMDLADTAALLQAMASAASAGLPISKAAIRDIVASVRAEYRAARGLPESRPRLPTRLPRQPDTIEHEEEASSHNVESAARLPEDESTET
jgi:hypothetical protein